MGTRISAIIVAGGSSSRMGFDKLSYLIDGKSVLYHSVEAFSKHPLITDVVIVTRAQRIEAVKQELKGLSHISAVVAGGKERQDSVAAGLAVCGQSEYIAIHDGARPFVSQGVIDGAIRKAMECGAAAPAVPVKDTIKYSENGKQIDYTPRRAALYAVQTPQVFRKELYLKALRQAAGTAVTDDCMLMESAGFSVFLTQGEYGNIKITTKEDLPKEDNKMRIGHGYDVHRLVEGRKLILGGIEIPFEKGLLGHSDADVLSHAVTDALLGAVALGDIGRHFPDTDPAYKGADSVQLLRQVMELLKAKEYYVVNADATILCQRPKLASYLPAIRENLAKAMELEQENLNIKATTEEGLGFTGTGEGIAVHCVALLEKREA